MEPLKGITIAVDFDGTLVEHAFPGIGQPNIKFISFLIELKKNHGCRLILWTCREGETLDAAVESMKELGLEFDAVNDNIDPGLDFAKRKICAHLYIDDRAIHPDLFMERLYKGPKD